MTRHQPGQKRVATDYFANSALPPPPVAEQHRIVAKVDELMGLCDRLVAAQAERERRRDRLAGASLHRLNRPDDDGESLRVHARFHLDHLPPFTVRPNQIPALRQNILNLRRPRPFWCPRTRMTNRLQGRLAISDAVRRRDSKPSSRRL